MRLYALCTLIFVSTPVLVQTAHAEGEKEERKRLSLSTFVSVTNTPVRIDSIDVDVPDAPFVDSLDVSIGDEVDISNTAFGVSARYFVLPFLEISASGSYVTTQSNSEIQLAGTFSEDALLFEGDFDLTVNSEVESDGFGFNTGAAVYVPIAKIGNTPVIARASAQFGFADLSAIDTQTITANFSFIRQQKLFGKDLNLALGSTYIEIDRETELTTVIGPSNANVLLAQSIDQPWSLTSSVSVPINERFNATFSSVNNFDGLRSFIFQVSVRY
ncbi:MAG: hypothetical protein AAGJ73_15580 [Pseudomonadota bacterium]